MELEGLPPPPSGVTASAAKFKGQDNYKQGQFADAIKWLSWAVVLLEKSRDSNSMWACYKEVGKYKKAVADCFVQRCLFHALLLLLLFHAFVFFLLI